MQLCCDPTHCSAETDAQSGEGHAALLLLVFWYFKYFL
jgi:hypothetical protein